jgi:BirA family transcriptional regulator, biotin operon repressor / biotin---[acetyl-CoA-carboxylase] ligase
MSRVQIAGKGRENRSWHSQAGGLWMTLTLLPPNPGVLAKIPGIATIAIVKSMESSGLPGCAIKPPNDVYCGGRKIAGVLADASLIGNRSIVYLGLGINVNNDPSTIQDISQTSTSFKAASGVTLDLLEFTASLIESLDTEYDRLIATRF